MPSRHPSSAHETEHSSRNILLRMQSAFQQSELPTFTPENIDHFIALYEKHTGFRLAQGDATVKAQRLLSLVRLITPYAVCEPDSEAPVKK